MRGIVNQGSTARAISAGRNAFGKFKQITIAATLAAGMVSNAALAETVTLDFENMQYLSWVNEYYNGGTNSVGESGPGYGVSFINETMRIYSADEILGLFSNNPSGKNIITYDPRFANGPSLSVEGGFAGASFYYSATGEFSVGIVDADFLSLGLWTFSAQHNADGCSDTYLCNWSLATLEFEGVGKYMFFLNAGSAGYDDLSFILPGTTPPGGAVPEPAQWLMLIAGFGLAGTALRRRRPYETLSREALPAI